MTEKDIELILSMLGEATFAGLFSFVGKNKMQKTVEVVHVFNKKKLTPGINLPTVRIIIEPMDDDSSSTIKNKFIN